LQQGADISEIQMKTNTELEWKLISSCALTVMLVAILLMLFPNQSLTTHEIEGCLIGLFSALLIEMVWTKC
jgi:hypothetical protein